MSFLRQELRHGLEAAQEAARREIAVVGLLVSAALRAGHYHSIDSLLQDWAAAQTRVTGLSILGPNDVVLGTYHSGVTPARSLTLTYPIRNLYHEPATLNLQGDVSGVYEFHNGFRNKFLLGLLMFSGLLDGAVDRDSDQIVDTIQPGRHFGLTWDIGMTLAPLTDERLDRCT